MSPILVPKLCAIIFPFPKLLKAHKVVLNSTRPLNENTHPLIFLRGSGHQKSESANRQWRGVIKMQSMLFCTFICNSLRVHMRKKYSKTMNTSGFTANEHCLDVPATIFVLQLRFLFASFSHKLFATHVTNKITSHCC